MRELRGKFYVVSRGFRAVSREVSRESMEDNFVQFRGKFSAVSRDVLTKLRGAISREVLSS